MSDNTETPRTDAAWNPAIIGDRGVVSVMVEMKALERELNQLLAENERLKHERNRIGMEMRNEYLTKLAQWREMAVRLAEQLQACDRFICGKPGEIIGLCAIKDALDAFDILSKSIPHSGDDAALTSH